MFRPSGIYAAMLTPFTSDGNINETVIRQMVEFMIAKGIHGIFPAGSVGEFAHMSVEEIEQVIDIVTDQVQGRVPVVAGAGSTCPENSIRIAEIAQKKGCDGVVICPPYYYSVQDENLQMHFTTIADAIDLPVILYNIPLFCEAIPQSVVFNLSKHPNIIGIKDSSGSMVDMMHYLEWVNQQESDFRVLTGREDMLSPALQVGAKGGMTASACIFPEILIGIWDAYQENDWDKMMYLQNSLLPVLRLMFEVPFPIGFKAAMELRGFEMGPLKQCISSLQKSQVRDVKEKLEKAIYSLKQVIQSLDQEK